MDRHRPFRQMSFTIRHPTGQARSLTYAIRRRANNLIGALLLSFVPAGRAARLYFEMVGAINKKQNTVVNEQNNYIQINNTILSQENLKALTAEQLNQIEGIITNNGYKKNSRPVEITNNNNDMNGLITADMV